MCRFKTKILCLFLFLALGLAPGSVGAEEALIWPLETKLKFHDTDIIDQWHDAGDVYIWNTRDDLIIDIVPFADYKIKTASVHIVQDVAAFEAIIDKNGKPRPNKFVFKTDYLVDDGILADDHHETISLDFLENDLKFNICWGVNPARCPPFFYTIVHVELQKMVTVENELGEPEEVPVGPPEAAYAYGNPGTFDRYPGTEDAADGVYWGYYVTYPLAKIVAGHFIDANVNGLTYETPTQFGVTGEDGQLWYIPDERIDFFVGSLALGNALGDRRISPMDLFEGGDLDDDRVLNVARLLQSLDGDGNPAQGAINITETVVGCLEEVLDGQSPDPEVFFADDVAVTNLIDATVAACAGKVTLKAVSKEEARENLNSGMKAANLMKKNVSKTPDMKSDKAKIEIMPVYVPALTSDDDFTEVVYHDADGEVIEKRDVAKPIVVAYIDEVEGTGASDVSVAISRDDGDTWKRRNISRTADKVSSPAGSAAIYPGESQKPMLKVKDNMIFLAWTDKYCRGGRPSYAITVCPDTNGDGLPDPCEICRDTAEDTVCTDDYPGDDAYYKDDLYGVGGPQRSVVYDPVNYPDMGEVAFSCVWTSRAVIDPASGDIQWFKPERVTSGRRDAFQLFAGAGEDVAFAIVWQEDPKGLMPGEGDGPGDGGSGAKTHNKTDIWYSYITMGDFAKIDYNYPTDGRSDNEDLENDPELAGRVKALVPMSLPVKISDNDVCSEENIVPDGGNGEHDYDGEGEGTHRYCGTLEGIGTAEEPGSNPLCAYTIEKANPKGEIHHVCVTADGRLLDGNTGASRPNIFLQPYKKPDGSKGAWAIIGYEESKGVNLPPEVEHEEDDPCGTTDEMLAAEEADEDRYKADKGKNVIYHSFDFAKPETVGGGGIINLPETYENGDIIYLVNEDGSDLLDWAGNRIPATENARRVRFITQPKSKAGASKTVLVALYRQGEEGSGKPADIFMRRIKAPSTGNPYAFGNFLPGAQNLSSVSADPAYLFQDPFDSEKPEKMLRWTWSPENLADKSWTNPRDDSRAHRGALNGDDLLIGYTWTPNWGRNANDKYDFYIRRSFNGGQSWTTDPAGLEPIDHNVVFRVPIIDEENQEVIWDEAVVTTTYAPGASEPPRNVSNLRNNRTSVLEPRLVKTPGTILTDGVTLYPEDEWNPSVYQLAYGLEFNQNQAPNDVVFPKTPLDIDYSRTQDKGQRYESVILTPQGGSGKPQEGWNPLAQDKPQQGAAQLRQTPDGSRMYSIWLEEGDGGSDIMFRRVDYRE